MRRTSLKILLIGSGHAHLEVINGLTKSETEKHQFILVSPFSETYYSGLIPRLLTGEIEPQDLTILSADYAKSKGLLFIQDSLASVDQIQKNVTLKSGQILTYDILSINIGGTPIVIPTEAPFQTINLRPFDQFLPRWKEVQKICSKCLNPTFVVIGGGSAAVEIATALRIRLNKNQAFKSEIHLITQSSRLCVNYKEKISKAIHKNLVEMKIQVHFDEKVDLIHSKYILLKNNAQLKFDLVFVVTSTKPSNLLNDQSDSTLRISPFVFAVGDAIQMKNEPQLPRSGVIAIQQGRHLLESLRRILNGQKPLSFKIKSKQINILISKENSARLIWGPLHFEGALALKIKNWIDQNYIKKFKLLSFTDPRRIQSQ